MEEDDDENLKLYMYICLLKLWLACNVHVLNAGSVPAGFGVFLKKKPFCGNF